MTRTRRREQTALPASVTLPPRWRGTRVVLLVALTVLLTAGLLERVWLRRPPGNDHTRYHNRSFKAVRVLDGDTLDIDVPDGEHPTTRVRLWGVDAPELAHDGEPTAHFGPEAHAFAERLLDGRRVHIVLAPEQTRGLYGRLLAYVFLERGGRMFNEMLLEEGYAYADLRFDHIYRQQFIQADRHARRAGSGLWQDVTLEDMPEWKQRFEQR